MKDKSNTRGATSIEGVVLTKPDDPARKAVEMVTEACLPIIVEGSDACGLPFYEMLFNVGQKLVGFALFSLEMDGHKDDAARLRRVMREVFDPANQAQLQAEFEAFEKGAPH